MIMFDNDSTFIVKSPFQHTEYKKPKERCEYCGIPLNANCHAHASYCPYYCKSNPVGSLPLGRDIEILGVFLLTYLIIKIFKWR